MSASPAPAQAPPNHRAVEPALRLENAGRVDEHDLRFARDRDAAHDIARGLHLGRDDGDLGADQRVDQRRFAGVRRADDGDEAAARCHAFARTRFAISPLTRRS